MGFYGFIFFMFFLFTGEKEVHKIIGVEGGGKFPGETTKNGLKKEEAFGGGVYEVSFP